MFICRRWLICALLVSGSCFAPPYAAAQQFQQPAPTQPPARPNVPARPTAPSYGPPAANSGAPTTGAPPQYNAQPTAQYGPQPGVQQPAAPSQGMPPAPQVPFQLSPQQQNDVDVVLRAWEQRSAKISTLKCNFKIWEYDNVFGPADKPKKENKGTIRYVRPDKGEYKVEGPEGEHWISTGKAIFEMNHPKKQLIERRLPPELQGKAISDGPLPFIFGIEAEKVKYRYFVRVITPAESKGQIWLEAYPKFRQDAANFQRIEVILSETDFLPFAVQLYLPNGKNRTVYRFSETVVNSHIDNFLGFFSQTPRTPFGYQRIVEEAPQVQTAPPETGQVPPQATLPGSGVRK
jgi:TIGR03009 family protein